MKKLMMLLFFTASFTFGQTQEVIFQYSTIGALMNGNYDGSINFKGLAEKGDFGIGTLDNLDGEMIALDGVFYQINSSGNVIKIAPQTETPFADVVFFKTNNGVIVKEVVPSSQMTEILKELVDGTNYPVAIKITGNFESIKTRSIPPQKPPFPLLSEAAKQQAVFNYTNTKGVLVGFYFPKYFAGVNMPGFHFHFISDDKQKGGHVLDYTIMNPLVVLNFCKNIDIQLLNKFDNNSALTIPNSKEVEKIEK